MTEQVDMNGADAISVIGMQKTFGSVVALENIDLAVPKGSVMGLLGPNGAGRTTFVRILTTLLSLDSGEAFVAGYNVARNPSAVRSVIGLAGQYAAVDENLTGQENLEMVGRLYHLKGAESKRRAADLLERFDLTDAANRRAKAFSGGMRRRLDLAASLLAQPQVLFLDEPTTGLDPRGRIGMWDVISELVNDGTTVLLTTQYLEEADYLADTITVLDEGRIIAQGTSDQLKSQIGGEVLEVRVADRSQAHVAAEAIAQLGAGAPQVTEEVGVIALPVTGGASVLAEAVRRLDAAGLTISDLAIRQPTLDDVFLSLTGHTAESGDASKDSIESRTRRRTRRVR